MENEDWFWITSHLGSLVKVNSSAGYINVQVIPLTSISNPEGLTDPSVFDKDSITLKTQLVKGKTVRSLIVAAKKCLDSESGVLRPFILTETDMSDGTYLYQCVGLFDEQTSSTNFCLQIVGEFRSGIKLTELKKESVKIVDGPSVVWIDKNVRFLSCALFLEDRDERKSRDVENISLEDFTSGLKRDSHSSSVCMSGQSILGWHHSTSNIQLILIGKVSLTTGTDKRCYSELFGLVITVCNKKVKHSLLDKSHITDLIPNEYSSVLSCLFISKLELSSNLSEDSKDTSNLSVCTSRIFAATSLKHLLEFSCGRLLRCVDICSTSVDSIQLIYGHLSEMHIGLFSSTDKLFTGIRCEDLQIKATENSVGVMVVDDFTETGTDQVMLIESPLVWPPAAWLLIDLGPTWLKHPPDSKPESIVEPSSSRQAAVEALQARLQTDIVRLEGVKAGCFERGDLIGSACDTVRSLTLDQDPPTIIRSDLALLCGKTDPCINSSAQSSSVSDWLEVKDTWQRFFDGRWVVGVELLNISDRELVGLSLNACLPSHVGLEKDNQISHSVWLKKTTSVSQSSGTSGQTASHSNESIDDWVYHPSSSKRPRVEEETPCIFLTDRLYPGHKTCILCVMPQPLFGVQPTDKLLLFLSFFISSTGDDKSNQMASYNKMTLFIGRIHCSLKEMFDQKKLINLRCPKSNHQFGTEKTRDRLTVDGCQGHVELILLSTQTNIAMVTSVLLNNNFSYQPTFDCYLFPESYENCRCVRIELIDRKEAPRVIIFFRDMSQLWLVLHILYSILPDDVLLVPMSDGDTAHAHCLSSLQGALNREMTNTLTSLSDLLKTHVSSDDVIAIDIDSDKPLGVPSVRDTFTKVQAELEDKRTPGVVSAKSHWAAIQCLEEARKTTDSSVIDLGHKTLSFSI